MGPDKVLTVNTNADGNKVEATWLGTWKQWSELHTSNELLEIQTAADTMLASVKKTKGSGKGKGKTAGASGSK